MNNSRLENKTDYELQKIKERFSGTRGQTQGSSHYLNNQWIPEELGAYGSPIHLGKNNGQSIKQSKKSTTPSLKA